MYTKFFCSGLALCLLCAPACAKSSSSTDSGTDAPSKSKYAPYHIAEPQRPVTQAILMPAAGGCMHTLSCPSVLKSQGEYMYAEEAVRIGMRPTGTCPQCHAALSAGLTSPVIVSIPQRASNYNTCSYSPPNQYYGGGYSGGYSGGASYSSLEKQLKEIEDNRRWDNKMAQWENKQPMYVGSYVNGGGRLDGYRRGYSTWGCSNPYNSWGCGGYYYDGGRMADVERTKAIINANNEAARNYSDMLLRLNGR